MPFTPEQAEYHRLMLTAGFQDEYDRALEQLQLEEDPLSDLTLALSYYQSSPDDTASILREFVLDHLPDHDAVFQQIWQTFHSLYTAGALPSRDILRTMYSIAQESGQTEHDFYYTLLVIDEAYDLAAEGIISWADYRICAETYLLEQKLVQPWEGKPSGKPEDLSKPEPLLVGVMVTSLLGAAISVFLLLANMDSPGWLLWLSFALGLAGLALVLAWKTAKTRTQPTGPESRKQGNFYYKP